MINIITKIISIYKIRYEKLKEILNFFYNKKKLTIQPIFMSLSSSILF